MGDWVRIGLVGSSWWADATYQPALTRPPEVAVRAVTGCGRRTAEPGGQ